MDTSYIYAGTRAKALEYKLLSETQEERLLSAKSTDEVFKVLQDTFLAPLLTKHEQSDLESAFGQTLVEGKNLLDSIAPDPEMLDVLWLKYDFFNLNVIVKGKSAGLSSEEIIEKCFTTSKCTPEKLLLAFEANTLSSMNMYFNMAVEATGKANQVFEQDIIINAHYLKAIGAILFTHSRNVFLSNFITLLIDFFNLITALRIGKLTDTNIKMRDVFVAGGTFKYSELEGEKQVLEQFSRIGGEKYWIDAVKDYRENGDYSLLEKGRDEYIAAFLKSASTDVFSPAPLFAYFTAMKNSVQIIKSVVTAKESGMKERDLRFILRKLYA